MIEKLEIIEHPDVVKAREDVAPILEALSNSYRPAIERLQRLIAKGDEEMRRKYGMQLVDLMADAQRQREAIIRPVLYIANMCASTIVIQQSDITPPPRSSTLPPAIHRVS